MKRKNQGFTLAELLIVVAIIAVLVAISIPIFTSQLEKSREAVDAANIRAQYAEVMTEALMTKTDVDYSAKAISLKQLKSDWEGGSSSEFYTSLSRLGDIDGTPQVGGTAWVEYKMTPTSSGNNIIIHYTAGSGGSGSGGTGTGSGGTTPTTPALPLQAEGGLQDPGGNNTSWEDLLSDGILVEHPPYHGKQELLGVATGKTIAGTLVIKEAITSIGQNAFKNQSGLTGVVFSNKTEVIARSAFEGTNIDTLSIPSSVTTVADRAFANMSKLENVTWYYNPDTELGPMVDVFKGSGTNSSTGKVNITFHGTEAQWNDVKGKIGLTESQYVLTRVDP